MTDETQIRDKWDKANQEEDFSSEITDVDKIGDWWLALLASEREAWVDKVINKVKQIEEDRWRTAFTEKPTPPTLFVSVLEYLSYLKESLKDSK
jgi:hypothetical protein